MTISINQLFILQETLVEKLFNEFININIKEIYNDSFFDNFAEVIAKYKIKVVFDDSDSKRKVVSGRTRLSNDSKIHYIIYLYVPQEHNDLGEQTLRETINTLLHEFSHCMILNILKKLSSNESKHKIINRFITSPNVIVSFNINDISKDNCESFLKYIFDVRERSVWAFTIAFSHFYHNGNQSIYKSTTLNDKYILGFKEHLISPKVLNEYICSLNDDMLALFQIQYAIHVLDNKKKWINKLTSLLNLIDKYHKRLGQRNNELKK